MNIYILILLCYYVLDFFCSPVFNLRSVVYNLEYIHSKDSNLRSSLCKLKFAYTKDHILNEIIK